MLAGLIVLVVLMALVAIPVAVSASGGSLPLGAIFGVLSVLVMGAGVVYWFTRRKKDQGSYHSQERQEVVLSPAGITLRGVGPIPWADFGPAGHRMVEAEYQSGRIRRAVMELTPRGRVNVNERLDPHRSDVDLLVDYLPTAKRTFRDFFRLRDELEEVIGHRVDLVEPKNLRNPYIAQTVFAATRDLYAA